MSDSIVNVLRPPHRRGSALRPARHRSHRGESQSTRPGCHLPGSALGGGNQPRGGQRGRPRFIKEVFTNTDISDFVGSVRCTAPPGEGMFTGVSVEIDEGNRIITTLRLSNYFSVI